MPISPDIPEQDSTQVRIEIRAYEIWLHEGCPHGHDLDHWLRAESEVATEAAPEPSSPATSKDKA